MRRLCAVALAALQAVVVQPAARADRSRVALAPLGALIEGGGDLGPLEQLVEAGLAAVPDQELVPARAVRQLLRKGRRRELESCEGEVTCLADLGRLAGVAVVVSGEASALPDGQVVYLKAIDVARGVELGGTTLVVTGRPSGPAAAQAARAAAYRLLAPADYAGLLVLKVDIAGATVFVDGQPAGATPLAPLTLPVGTHALRVTHPTYRDFVRFVDVPFGQLTKLTVDLSAYPIVSDALRENPAALEAPRPWTKSPWVLVGAGVALAVVTAVVVATVFPSGPAVDRDVTVKPPP